jgi:hypothetical protein
MTLLSRLAAHLTENGGVALHAEHGMGATEFAAASEWGREAHDSPMAGAAAYGIGDTLGEALEVMLAQAGRPAEADDQVAGAEELAAFFHATYERLAPSFGYETREASAVAWERVPEQNRRLMVAVAGEVLEWLAGADDAASVDA